MSYPFGVFGPEHLNKIRPGIECFNQQHYWECHEVLEDVWLEDRQDPARLVYWAVIQVAASMVHVREENLPGAVGMLNKAKDKFRRCEEKKVETDLVEKHLSWAKLKSLVRAVPESGATLEEFQELYQFRFENFPEE